MRLLVPSLAAVFVSLLAAQTNPHAGFIYPAGGRQGTTVEVRMGGLALVGARGAYVSGAGVTVKSVEYVKPISGKDQQFLREELQKLNEKRSAASGRTPSGGVKVEFTEADKKRIEEIRDKLEEWQRRQFIPSLSETVVLQVEIAPDAPAGTRELRVETLSGMTNPIVFCVGELPEYVRKASRVGPAYNVLNGGTPIMRPVARQPDPPTDVALPVVVNGQMMPGAADQYRFHARKGQHLVLAADARELIPYVSDAVPGWFQAAIALRDAQGKELAAADHFLFHPDPLLHYEIPANGDYIAEIHDSIFRGREDFVYRMAIGELPVITGLFPLGGRSGTRAAIQTYGWNLPAASVRENLQGKASGVHPVSLRKDGVTSNQMQFVLDTLPETTAKPGIAMRAKAQQIKLPMVVNGRIAHPGEPAFFRFEGHAGDEIVAEVMARRLGSPLDSMLRLTDAAGKQLAFNDDFEDKSVGLITHQADSSITFKLPAKGTYYLELADAQRKGGQEYAYRLRISQPRPDFELRVVPASFNVRSGSTVPFTVYAIRRDGFAGGIALKLQNAPGNFVLSGAAVPAGQDRVRLTLTVPRSPGSKPFPIQLSGQATVAGREITRTAVPAEDMEQAFMYHHIVAEDAWLIRVLGSGTTVPWRAIDKPVVLTSGTTTSFELPVPAQYQSGVQFVLRDPPEGISIRKTTADHDGVSVQVNVQADKAKPGLRGNLIVDMFRDVPANPAAGVRQARRQAMGTAPAIPFEVVAQATAVK